MKPMDHWTLECHTMSLQEGWLLTNYDQAGGSIVAICKLNDPTSIEDLGCCSEEPKFQIDKKAEAFVLDKALRGSVPHLLALWLAGRAIEKEMLLDLPDFFTADKV